jgi:hypothetical protein
MVKRSFSAVRAHWKSVLALAFMVALVLFLTSGLYPAAWLRFKLGIGPYPAVYLEAGSGSAMDVGALTDGLQVNPHSVWMVTRKDRVSACDNRPGRRMNYVRVRDANGDPLGGVKIRFDTEPSRGIAYEHLFVWGVTDENGYLEWQHLGIPTRYRLFMGEDEEPLIERIRADLGNEYCNPSSWPPSGANWHPGGWRPVNQPGVYSYWFELQSKEVEGEAVQ